MVASDVSVCIVAVISLLYFGEYFGTELLAMILIWFSGVAYVNSFVLNKIFKKYM